MKIKPVCNASAQEAIWGTEWNGDNINLLAPELFFFYFSTHCIKNVNKTGTKHVRIMKQTAFWREKNWKYISCLKYSLPVFVE